MTQSTTSASSSAQLSRTPQRSRQHRILVTGSRRWPANATEPIRDAILDACRRLDPTRSVEDGGWPNVTLVHGSCKGLDYLAATIAASLGLAVEPHPADWNRWGRSAGPRRNATMVRLGADVCLAFPIGASPGTRGCMATARAANIPLVIVEGQSGGA